MRKISVIFLLILLCPLFSACSFRGDGVSVVDEKSPYTVSVIMQIPADMVSMENFLSLKDEIEAYTADLTGSDFSNAAVEVDTDNYIINDGTASILLDIRIGSVKGKKVTVESSLFYREQTIIMFNPLTVLKPIDGVTYVLGLETERRSSAVPNAIEGHTDGKYQYQWSTHSLINWDWQNSDIIFYNKYANTPVWYAAAIIIALIVGIIVYFTCKKSENKDIIS